jgi:hypothetical protein
MKTFVELNRSTWTAGYGDFLAARERQGSVRQQKAQAPKGDWQRE